MLNLRKTDGTPIIDPDVRPGSFRSNFIVVGKTVLWNTVWVKKWRTNRLEDRKRDRDLVEDLRL